MVGISSPPAGIKGMLEAEVPLMTANELLTAVDCIRQRASGNISPDTRSALGQFFTPRKVAEFLAGLFTASSKEVHLLDPGAGVGCLTAAFVAAVCRRTPEARPKTLRVTAYEIDPNLSRNLAFTLGMCGDVCKQAGINFESDLRLDDFIFASARLFNNRLTMQQPQFDCVILNPPYRKINQDSDERRAMNCVGLPTSNLYTAFLFLAFKSLKQNGELVAITPRSFCNGAYFKNFRTELLKEMELHRIHVFESRQKAFREDDVLQENIIFHAVRSFSTPEIVSITSSHGPDDDAIEGHEVTFEEVVQRRDPNKFIHIVADDVSQRVALKSQRLSATLSDLGLSVSTGRVVDFRAVHVMKKNYEQPVVPLIYPRHFGEDGFIFWPNENRKKPDALIPEAAQYDLLNPAGTYVLVKRFSSKEEPRRIVASVYDPSRIPYPVVGFENHTNYFHTAGVGLNREIAVGLAVFLNSTFIDTYFRNFNGHTQVNATDLKSLKYPSLDALKFLAEGIHSYLPRQEEIDIRVEELLET